MQEIKILIIDDDEDDYFITSEYLEEITEFNVSCNWCFKNEEALIKLSDNSYDAYFIDYRLGAKTGLEILKEAILKGCNKPVILLTGKGNAQIDRLAVENGAYDYLIKGDLNTEILERSLRYALERYKNFKLLNDNEKKYRLLFENAASFIFTCNSVLNFTECNPASIYLLGCLPEQLKNRSLFDFIALKHQPNMKELINGKKSITNLTIELITNLPDPVIGNLCITYFDLPDQQSYWQGIILDETLRAKAEQAKFQKEKLEATYRLVVTLAHEIRNPLTNICLSVEGIEEKKIDDQAIFIDIIKRSSTRINSIINELLQSSKAIELKLESVDIIEVVKDVIEIANDRIKLKNIGVKTLFPINPLVKSVDIEKITIAFLNLIVNAIEAMEADAGELYVGVQQSLDSTQIIIKDTGSGISEKNLKNLFEPYFTTKKNGMGLGLVSTLNIIKAHKADIKVESKENIGTTFIIAFPNT
jgi:signal transduction histidine kinase